MSEIELTRLLIGGAALLMAFEDWSVRGQLGPDGPRAWAVQRNDFSPGVGRTALDYLFSERGMTLTLAARVAAALGLLISPHAIDAGVLLFGTWAWAVRWRGTYNGGSDAMMMIVLTGLFAYLCHAPLEKPALTWIGVNLVLSFTVAGLAKLRNAEWRDGRALRAFARRYEIHAPGARAAGWMVMLFEVSFPLGLYSPEAAIGYAALGLVFQAINAYAFGLNRFWLAWAAAYPALHALASR